MVAGARGKVFKPNVFISFPRHPSKPLMGCLNNMDPLSISASIAALLQVLGKVLGLISEIASSSTEIRCLIIEITTTRALLSSIEDIASVYEAWNENLRGMAIEEGPMNMLGTLLSKSEHRLAQEARKKCELGRLGRKLTWPWRAQETREMIKVARAPNMSREPATGYLPRKTLLVG